LGKSFNGLNLRDQRLANGGNQFTVEPPDQALCVGKGFVLESVNDVLRVYDTGGSPLSGVVDLNTFYGYPAAIDRTNLVFGPVLTDPVCYYDPDNQRFVHVVLTLDADPVSGDLLGSNHLDIAVSNTSSPLGSWTVYQLPVQDDGTQGTPSHTGCPCVGDYPHIGADRNGVYLTTNEYPFSDDPGVFGNNFNGAQLYAISKKALASGASTIQVVQFESLVLGDGTPGFTVWPAQSPAGEYDNHAKGTEYFLSSTAAEEALNDVGLDNRIGAWALTNTKSLDSNSPDPTLSSVILGSESYGVPPRSEQKIGNVPLRDCLVTTCRAGVGPSPFEAEGPLDSNDSRMQQVWFSDGRLWGALDTLAIVKNNVKAAIAFFVVRPRVRDDASFSASISSQGYLAVANNNVTYPAIAVLPNGKGVMAFTLVGKDYYPSAAYTFIDRKGTDKVHIAGKGAGPQDGFSEYNFFANPGSPARPRWGDYGAAVTDGKTIWIASEFIAQTCTFVQFNADTGCGGTRVTLGNWATRISAVKP
jgi:hypothetical protein